MILRLRSGLEKIIFILIIAGVLFFQTVSYAQSPDASPTAKIVSPTASVEEKTIKNFGDKIATKVAEIVKEKNNKALSGFITNIKGLTIKISNENNEEYEVRIDEVLTKYYQITGSVRKEIKFNDLKKDSFIIVSGVLNDKTITANTLYVDEMFLVKSGKVTGVDAVDYELKVVTTEKDTFSLRIETVTKQQMINTKTYEIERIGFSKIKEGDTVHFVVKKVADQKDNTYSAIKILIIPQEYFMK